MALLGSVLLIELSFILIKANPILPNQVTLYRSQYISVLPIRVPYRSIQSTACIL